MVMNTVIGGQRAELKRISDEHPLWTCRLFEACRAGALDRGDFQYIFSQYQLYSKSFTRFIAALMANCDNDLYRSILSKNLWEEGGGCEPELRHAEIFRRFLRDSLAVESPELVEYDVHTLHFVDEYLQFCTHRPALAVSAFLSLGTEAIVPPMYQVFITGLRGAGLRDDELEFFKIHVACDDDHAQSLEDLMVSYRGEPGWFEACRSALIRALDLRFAFFEHLIEGLQRRRLRPILRRIDARESLCPPGATPVMIRHREADAAPALYTSRIDAEGIEFSVTRIPLVAEVLDPRRVVVPPGKRNERHRHAHETFLYFVEGAGQVEVDGTAVDVGPGDSVLVPRWALHQTSNTGTGPLRFVAITDYRLTDRALFGDAKAYRRDESANQHRRE
jgi:quercetin dioxygenase-like cupin family protein/pyrroloquinoline quinone (PQQ) biosynthesis protein C